MKLRSIMVFAVLMALAVSGAVAPKPVLAASSSITVTASTGGSVTPSFTAHQTDQTVDITGYVFTPVAGGTSVTFTNIPTGADVQLSFTPATGYVIGDIRVGGESQGTGVTFTITPVDGNYAIVATFALDGTLPQVTASWGPGGWINTVDTQPQDTAPAGPVKFDVDPVAGKTFYIIPNSGFHAVSFSEDENAVALQHSYFFTAKHTINAQFAANVYTFTYTAGANGTINGTLSQQVNGAVKGTQVTAVPNTGYHFTGWSDGVTTASRIDRLGNINATGNFAINVYTLAYTPGANGTITGNLSQQVNYGVDGTPVTAVPKNGYYFAGWSDGITTAGRIDRNATINTTANFTAITYTLTVAAANGTVTRSPDQTSYLPGTPVKLTATPATGYSFTGWNGDASGNTNPLTVNVDGNRVIAANFAINTFAITASVVGNGSVNGPAMVNYGATPTFTVTPAPGYMIASITVDGNQVMQPNVDANRVGSYTFSPVGANSTISATFAATPITVSAVSPGSGPLAGGTVVTITGTNYYNGAAVTIGGVAAPTVTVIDQKTITATTPAGSVGGRDVVVTMANGQSATLAAAFAYVTTQATTLIISPQPTISTSSEVVNATLQDGTGALLKGEKITFKAGNVTVTAITNGQGAATTTLALAPGQYLLEAGFAGDAPYLPSKSSAPIIVYQPTGFVIWGGNMPNLGDAVKVDQTYMFWGAQWAKQVTAGAFQGNNSFKGYADSVIGATWTSSPGNSGNPPDSVGSYISVIVSTSITKKGSDISGNCAEFAILKVDNPAGYQPNPGHSATGKVVAIVPVVSSNVIRASVIVNTGHGNIDKDTDNKGNNEKVDSDRCDNDQSHSNEGKSDRGIDDNGKGNSVKDNRV